MAVFLVGAFAKNAGETNTGAMNAGGVNASLVNASVVNASVVNAGGAASPGRDHRYATTAAECAERQYPRLNNKLSEIHVGCAQYWHGATD